MFKRANASLHEQLRLRKEPCACVSVIAIAKHNLDSLSSLFSLVLGMSRFTEVMHDRYDKHTHKRVDNAMKLVCSRYTQPQQNQQAQ
jgi:hypothetical protein